MYESVLPHVKFVLAVASTLTSPSATNGIPAVNRSLARVDLIRAGKCAATFAFGAHHEGETGAKVKATRVSHAYGLRKLQSLRDERVVAKRLIDEHQWLGREDLAATEIIFDAIDRDVSEHETEELVVTGVGVGSGSDFRPATPESLTAARSNKSELIETFSGAWLELEPVSTKTCSAL